MTSTIPITLPGLTDEQVSKMFPFGLVMLAHVGSKSHGTYVPKADPESIDDIDLMGVFIPPLAGYFGFGRQQTVERKFGEFGPYDCVSYDLQHFVTLLMKSNPNVLGMLWMPPEHLLYRTHVANTLIENRDMFATRHAYQSFVGYARGQLHRMTHFDAAARLRMQQVEDELERRTIPLNLTPEELLDTRPDLYREAGSWKPGETGSRPFLEEKGCDLLETYRQMCNKYTSGYMGKKRRELVERFGYDVKNAAHLLRLLSMAIEFLSTGELHVDRTERDADQLMEVKRGEWTLARVKACADALFSEAEIAHQRSRLPLRPDREAVERMLVRMLGDAFAVPLEARGHLAIMLHYVHLVAKSRGNTTVLASCLAVNGAPCEWCNAGSPISTLTLTGSGYGYPHGVDTGEFRRLVGEMRERGYV